MPTLVEVKRSTDTHIHREVVGQMLDYAASAARYWTLESVMGACGRAGQSTDERLSAFLGEDGDAEAFWQTLKTNLQAGRMRLVLVAGELPQDRARACRVHLIGESTEPSANCDFSRAGETA
ncbi:MAG: hypothetical protein EXQ97_07120 [Alphaproteobacteria bacterium]|nr:hypothetical protein [Alphaproteobacteria bacterium]